MAQSNNNDPLANVTPLETLKEWFMTGKIPTQSQFWAALDSFWHKDQEIAISRIKDLANFLKQKLDTEAFKSHVTSDKSHKDLFETKVDKVPGKELSDNNFTDSFKKKLEDITLPTNISLKGGNSFNIINELNYKNLFISPKDGDSITIRSGDADKIVMLTIISDADIDITGDGVSLDAPNGLTVQANKPVTIYKVENVYKVIGETTNKK